AAQDGISDGMIAAQRNERPPGIEQRRNRLLYRRKGFLGSLRETEIARVMECSGLAQVHAVLGPQIRGIAIKRFADARRSLCCAGEIGGGGIEGNAEERNSLFLVELEVGVHDV